jgi:N-methylhydantoinase A
MVATEAGFDRLLTCDGGGTSTDVAVVLGGEPALTTEGTVGSYPSKVPMIDVVTVGAGGGSVAWVSPDGALKVGPRSAGADPGPLCYGRGGTEPTVTDAMVTMGFIDPDRYLAGRVQLKPELSREALDRTFGDRFGWSTEEAAAAVHDLVVVNMANAVREVSVGKGHDPREFMFVAYGGTLPLFASQIAERLAITKIVIPQNSSVFCALGLLSADFVMRNDQGVGWDLSKPDGVGRVNEIAEQMVAAARQEMVSEGFSEDQVEIQRSGDFRYAGQIYELTVPMAEKPLEVTDADALSKEFTRLYERTYGEGTAWKGVPVSLINYSVTVIGRQDRPSLGTTATNGASAEPTPRETRKVFLPGERRHEEIPIYSEDAFAPGQSVEGPAVIDESDTTIYVPPGNRVARDEYLNYVMTR